MIQVLVSVCDVDDDILAVFLSRADYKIRKTLKSFL